MPPAITVPTQENPETEMLHIKKVSVPGAFHQAYCGYRTRNEKPEEQTVDLEEDNVCTTCIDIFIRRNPDIIDADTIPEDAELTRTPVTPKNTEEVSSTHSD